jgi:Ca2+-binding RTX toxin-like protein
MPTTDISQSNGTVQLNLLIQTGVPALLFSGNNNNVTFLFGDLTGSGSSPAVLFTGTGNTFINRSSILRTGGAVVLQGSGGNDTVINYGGGSPTVIMGEVRLGGGNDYYQTNFNATAGDVHGEDGDDTLTLFQLTAAVRYFGDAGNDGLAGGSADDYLDGGADDDSLFGNDGNDILIGGSGRDVLNGGRGNDSLTGDGSDIAVFGGFFSNERALFADVQIAGSAGSWTLTDQNVADGDAGIDTLTGIDIVRFADQQVDLRLTRNELLLATVGQEFSNMVARYGLRSAHISGNGVTLINHSEIRGTGVVGAGGAVLVDADNVTLDNRAGASIIGLGNAVDLSGRTQQVEGGFTYVGAGFFLANAGLIEALEGTGVSLFAGNANIANSASGSIIGVTSGIAISNGVATINNAGTISGLGQQMTLQGGQIARQGGTAIAAGVLDLVNTGTIIGNPDASSPQPGAIRMGSRFSHIVNHGTIEGGYYGYGGARIENMNQSSGDFRIDATPNGQDANVNTNNQGFQVASLINSGTFNGSFILTGATRFNSEPPAPVIFTAVINNSGTFNGNIISNPTTAALPGGTIPDARYDESVTNSGAISGFLDLGNGNDVVINTGTISGLIDLGAGNDVFQGGAGADFVSGGAGDDRLDGGGGNDTVSYANSALGVTVHLDNPTSQDTVQQGLDTLIGFENIIGSASHDSLWGDAANNTITGGAGFDTIVSGGGTNILIGGADGDTYFVQGLNDTVTEAIGGGYDVVLAQTNFTLAAGSEVEALAVNTTAGIVLTGNELQQVLTGGVGDDTLNAGGGNDLLISGAGTNTLAGGTGDDIYYAQGTNDIITEIAGGGFDVVLAGGNLTLASNSEVEVLAVNTASGVTIIGSDITQTIQGGAGNDRFVGGLGNDTLTGSGGADTFVLRNTFVDRDFITDFTSGSDKIEISASLFGGGLSAGGLTAAQFLSGAGAVAATTAAQRFIYNSSTGNLYFDADGNGAGASVIIANLSNVGALTASDFIITASAEEPVAPKGGLGGDVMDVAKVFANDNVLSADVFDGGTIFTDQIIFADSGLERWGQVYQTPFV